MFHSYCVLLTEIGCVRKDKLWPVVVCGGPSASVASMFYYR